MEYPSNIMRGKTVLITGGTGGIGKATALALSKLGAQVVIIGRNTSRGEAALHELQQVSGSQSHHFLRADLSSQAEVRRLAHEFQQRFSHLHVLVNNVAGVYRQRQETVDGIEATFALGHLAPFLLTHLLLPRLQASTPSRIVNVTSEGHSMAQLDFDDWQARHFYRAIDIYVRVKLANLLFTYELARQLDGTGVTVNAVDPGGAHTQLTDSTTSDMLPPLMKVLYPLVARFAFTSVEKAAASSVYAAASPDLANVSGRYFNTKFQEVKSSKASYDTEAARQLWRISEDLTGIRAGEKLAV
jgi:NAD(P)-dependent dehydrogenase (short-subunit alcohol dehydrogenase family)